MLLVNIFKGNNSHVDEIAMSTLNQKRYIKQHEYVTNSLIIEQNQKLTLKSFYEKTLPYFFHSAYNSK